ncbi:RNA polymerase factor sigma-54 [Aeribacillus alveayuensis]|jgi:RNA polymerase sigma-54 factor|uniref:RNA polymerase sigma-54 factor n=1 Tax=Aeribacillus alveayuensis TaxID=279215 RepID=A0ABT9VLZ5_9BACI|nr:RNA polymerase sigma-54 factor [Bacillus alveayuensis]
MNMKVGLFQEQTLKLTMTKELQQAITLLQYSTVDLISYLQEVTLENPLIDFIDKSNSNQFYHNKRKQHTDEKQNWIENVSRKGSSLHEHLRSQLFDFHFSSVERQAMEILIDAVDSNGYMTEDLENISKKFAIPLEVLEKQLHVLQSLDPVGVGARSLQECLLLQLKQIKDKPAYTEFILREYFKPFAEKTWKEISKKTGLSLKEIQCIHDFIQTLNPRPGLQYEDTHPNYIIPDLIVEEKHGEWVVFYNDDLLPQIRISANYEPLIEMGNDSEIKSYVTSKIQQCRWLVKSLEQRKDTLVKVMYEIIRHQHEFFYSKNQILKPLTLKDIADSLLIHESTVSRAVKDKYVQTPFGLYELKYFFTNRVASNDLEDTSAANVKQMIQKLVEGEDKKRPLSDQKIADFLKKEYNMSVSRRTVAKYRDQLNIPASSIRKRYE